MSEGTQTTAPAQGSAPAQPAAAEPAKPMKFGDIDKVAFGGNDAERPMGLQEVVDLPEKHKDAPSDEPKKPATTDDEDLDDDDDLDEDEEGLDDEDLDDTSEDGDEEIDGEETEQEIEKDKDQPEDLHEVTVNGEKRKYTLQQMKNLVSSAVHTLENRKAWDAKVAKETQALGQYQAEIAVANTKITPIWEKLKANDAKGCVIEIAKSLDKSTLEVQRLLLRQHIPLVAQRLGLSEQEVHRRLKEREPYNQSLDIMEENDYLKSLEVERTKAKEQVPQKAPEVVEAEKQIRKAQQDHQIADHELGNAYKFLTEKVFNGDESKISVDNLVNTVLNGRVCDRAIDAILIRRPKLVSDQGFVDKTVKVLKQHPDWTADRLGRWIEKQARKRTTSTTDLAKDISRKVMKSGLKSRFENPSEQTKKPMKFSDLDEKDDFRLP